jgi:type I restriction enzyme, S subunit
LSHYSGESILIARVGANAGYIYRVMGEYGVSDNTIILQVNKKCSISYLEYQLKFKSLNTLVFGSGQPLITGTQVKNIFLPLPPLPEQRAIAGALSDTDDLIAGLEALIAKKQAIKQGAMQALLTGRQRLPGFEGEWEEKKLGEVLTVRHGKSQHAVVTPDGPYPIFASGGEIGRAIEFLYDKPSVLIGRKGTIDAPRYEDEPFWTVDTLFYTEIFKDNDAKYLYHLFNTIRWMDFNEASGVPSLNASTIENIEVILPSFPEQQAIATVLSDMDTELAALQQRLSKTRALKQGMMQELLTGRIRLVGSGEHQPPKHEQPPTG